MAADASPTRSAGRRCQFIVDMIDAALDDSGSDDAGRDDAPVEERLAVRRAEEEARAQRVHPSPWPSFTHSADTHSADRWH